MRTTTRPMPFTSEQMKQVFETNLIDFAIDNGFEISEKSKRNSRNSVHVKGYGGLFIFRHGRGYTCRSTDSKGNIIDFAKEYMGLDFKSAVETIIGQRAYKHTEHYIKPVEVLPRQPFELPPKDTNFNKVIAYLSKTRGIDTEIIYQLIKEDKIYQSKVERNGNSYTNCAFVGFDENGEAKYCALRSHSKGYNFRQDVTGSDKSYGFTMTGTSNRVYSFEAPIDAMSHATLFKLNGLDFKEDHRVSEGCIATAALDRYLKLHPEILEIVICYDNDIDGKLADGKIGLPQNLFCGKEEGQGSEMNVRGDEDEMKRTLSRRNHGQLAAIKAVEKYSAQGYDVMIQTPNTKDFNGDLLMFRNLLAQDNHEINEEMER